MTAVAVSVVIPVYNGAEHITTALESVAAQTRRDCEVVIVDDGSTDGTAEAIERFAARAHGLSVRLIRQENRGVSAARNRAIAASQGTFVAFLDADDWWMPDKLARQLAVMEGRSEVDLCFTGFQIVDDDGDSLPERFRPREGLLSVETLIQRNVVHTSTVMVRRSALQRTGGFDETLAAFEDFDLWLKVGALNDPGMYAVPRYLCAYRRHTAQTTRDWRKMHDGWLRMTARLERDCPEGWRRVRSRALAHNLEYCASLAYNAGRIEDMRMLMRQALRHNAGAILRRGDGVIMTSILLCSYLPRPVQIAIGRGFVGLRRTFRTLRDLTNGRDDSSMDPARFGATFRHQSDLHSS